MYTQEQLKLIDKQLINKWLAALESGEYKQTQLQLVNNNGQGFCCLGVACKVESSGKVRATDKGKTKKGFWYKAEDSRFWKDAYVELDMPPHHVAHKLGFFCEGPLDIYVYTNMNDNMHYSFKQIAQALREDYAEAGLDLTV